MSRYIGRFAGKFRVNEGRWGQLFIFDFRNGGGISISRSTLQLILERIISQDRRELVKQANKKLERQNAHR